MAITIADLGISQKELVERVVESIVDRVVSTTSVDDEENEYRRESSFLSEIRDTAKKLIEERARKEIDNRLTGVLDEILSGEFQPIDSYGEPKGSKTTLRDMVKERALKFLEERVNDKGNTVDSWSSSAGTRLDLSMKRAVAEICTATVQSELKSAVEDAKKQIGGMVAKVIVEKLLK